MSKRFGFRLRFLLVIAMAMVVGTWAFAQADQSSSAQDSSKDAAKDKKDKKKKDKKKKDKKNKGPQDPLDTEVFSDAVARNVLEQLRDGLEGHSQRLMLSAFDDDKFDGYLSFEDQIQAMFDKYDSFRVHFRIVQSTVEGPKGIVLVDFTMEEIPRSMDAAPQRKSSQVRFELERGRKGWRIVDMTPRGFFS